MQAVYWNQAVGHVQKRPLKLVHDAGLRSALFCWEGLVLPLVSDHRDALLPAVSFVLNYSHVKLVEPLWDVNCFAVRC